jgi:hypothetical protein
MIYRCNMDWGLPNLIATDRSAIHEEETNIYEQDIGNSLPLITMDQGLYLKDPRPWQFNAYIRCYEEAMQGPCHTVRELKL